MKTLKFATYNIKHASDLGRYTQSIGQLIKNEGIDIIGIQEIDMFCKRSNDKDILKEIATFSGLKFYHFYKTINWQNGEYGVGIISRYPFTTKEIILLPNCHEQRILVNASVNIENEELNFLVTHLELGSYQDVRKEQYEKIREVLDGLSSFVLTGDFNCENWQETGFFELEKHFNQYQIVNNPRETFLTFSGSERIGGGILPIDNIVISKDYKVLHKYMVDTDYSDHDILIMEGKK